MSDFETTVGINDKPFREGLRRITRAARGATDDVNQGAFVARKTASEFVKQIVTFEAVKQGIRASAEAARFAAENNSYLAREMERAAGAGERLRQSFGRDMALLFSDGGRMAHRFAGEVDGLRLAITNLISDTVLGGGIGNAAGVDAAMRTIEMQDRIQVRTEATRRLQQQEEMKRLALGGDSVAVDRMRAEQTLKNETNRIEAERMKAIDALGERPQGPVEAILGTTAMGGATASMDGTIFHAEALRRYETELKSINDAADRQLAQIEATAAAQRESFDRREQEQGEAARVREEAIRTQQEIAILTGHARIAGLTGTLEDRRRAERTLEGRRAATRAGAEADQLGFTGANRENMIDLARREAEARVDERYANEQQVLERDRARDELERARQAVRERAAEQAARDRLDRFRVDTLRLEGNDGSARALEIQIERRERLRQIAEDELLSEEQKKRLTEQTNLLLDRRAAIETRQNLFNSTRTLAGSPELAAQVFGGAVGGDDARSAFAIAQARRIRARDAMRIARIGPAGPSVAEGLARPATGSVDRAGVAAVYGPPSPGASGASVFVQRGQSESTDGKLDQQTSILQESNDYLRRVAEGFDRGVLTT